MQTSSRASPSRQPENPRENLKHQRDNGSCKELDEASGDQGDGDDDDEGPEGDEEIVAVLRGRAGEVGDYCEVVC